METDIQVRTCSRCGEEKPADAFYFNKAKQAPDSYCKECRKAVNTHYRKHRWDVPDRPAGRCTMAEGLPEDAGLRIRLLVRSMERVREMALKVRSRRKELECYHWNKA